MAQNNTPVAVEETIAPIETAPVEAVNEAAPVEVTPEVAPVAPEVTSAPTPEVSVPTPVVSTPAPAPVAPAPRLNGDLGPDLSVVSDQEPRKEVEDGRSYEITFIVIANNPEALDGAQKGVKSLIDGANGAVDNTRVSEVRRLSYPIAKRTEGIYVVVNARFEKALTDDLERFFKLEDSVLRHIILRVEA